MKLTRVLSLALVALSPVLAIPSEFDASLFSRAVGDQCSAPEGKGSCQKTSSCKGISYSQPLCPKDPNDVQCCVTISCKSTKGAGYCRSVSYNGCPGGTFDPANLCPGSQDIQCCVPGGGSTPPPPSYGSCTSKGRAGTCKSVSKQGCAGGTFDPANLCPGSQDIQCCVPGSSAPPPNYGSCTSKGRHGTCKSVSKQGCSGGTFDPANLCPGSQDIQCCVVGAPLPPLPPFPLPTPPSPCTPAAADALMFSTPIDQFDRKWDAKSPSCFDWSSDDCSGSPDNPLGFDFNYPCRRHDFGYRNSIKMHRCNADYKKRVDDNFQTDLYNYCSQFSGWSSWKGVECRRLADVYHEAVRKLGTC